MKRYLSFHIRVRTCVHFVYSIQIFALIYKWSVGFFPSRFLEFAYGCKEITKIRLGIRLAQVETQ